jgi:ADP-ribosyl-[dinitrogen reductase] hydrolase
MKLTPIDLDRAAGALVGAAAGDALGAGYEFKSHPPADAQMIGGGLGNWERGEWTDDTQTALCIAEITASGSVELEGIAQRFLDWYHSGPADVGIQTRSVLDRASSAADLTGIAADYHKDHLKNSAGNGSLMRTSPVALASLGDDKDLARWAAEVSALTHGDPLAGEACALWCVAIDRAVREARLDGVRDGLELLPEQSRPRWTAWLDQAEKSPPAEFSPNGYVVAALQAAHSAITQTPIPADMPCTHLQNALKAAVAIGNDTDTVAAVAGALLGARWGASAIPMEWRSVLHGWPGYRAADLVRLAVLSARRGEDDAQGWPSVQAMVPYYSASFPCEAIAVALDDDPGMFVGNVPGLSRLPSAPDVVLSLCRMGRGDVPAHAEHHELWLIDSADPADNPNLDFVLSDTAAAISRWRQEGRTVFVHCVRAESRTPTVAAAYRAQREGISAIEALERVRLVLPGAHPNRGFVEAMDRLWPRT